MARRALSRAIAGVALCALSVAGLVGWWWRPEVSGALYAAGVALVGAGLVAAFERRGRHGR